MSAVLGRKSDRMNEEMKHKTTTVTFLCMYAKY